MNFHPMAFVTSSRLGSGSKLIRHVIVFASWLTLRIVPLRGITQVAPSLSVLRCLRCHSTAAAIPLGSLISMGIALLDVSIEFKASGD